MYIMYINRYTSTEGNGPDSEQARQCVLSRLRSDVEKVGLDLRNAIGLEELQTLATDRDNWEEQ